MDRFDGNAARQLNLLAGADDDFDFEPYQVPQKPAAPKRSLRLLQKDVYSELARRRRRAQIAARHLLDTK